MSFATMDATRCTAAMSFGHDFVTALLPPVAEAERDGRHARPLIAVRPTATVRSMADALRVDSRIAIPLSEITLTYARSGGPGGQNVNKVASKAVLRFNLRRSPSVPESARRRALAELASRLTQNGEVVLSSGTYRDQPRNREAVLERLRRLLADAVRPGKQRVPTRPSAAARTRRLTAKKARGQLKRQRRPPGEEESGC